eukprot:gb/GEZN01014933.1/.p2 GENE.gb/GEZN01014933.1/~~gb/GEZN01014933.1/.p2  ORF type:complete len:147 (+),score=2.88 gb/GEZN01014933.1/:312-752(+)
MLSIPLILSMYRTEPVRAHHLLQGESNQVRRGALLKKRRLPFLSFCAERCVVVSYTPECLNDKELHRSVLRAAPFGRTRVVRPFPFSISFQASNIFDELRHGSTSCVLDFLISVILCPPSSGVWLNASAVSGEDIREIPRDLWLVC